MARYGFVSAAIDPVVTVFSPVIEMETKCLQTRAPTGRVSMFATDVVG